SSRIPSDAVDWSSTDSLMRGSALIVRCRSRAPALRRRHHHRRMIAGADVGEHFTARDALSDRLRREDVVDPPADVALAHVPPRRPPGEERFVTRVQRAADIDEMAAEQTVEQLALLGAL